MNEPTKRRKAIKPRPKKKEKKSKRSSGGFYTKWAFSQAHSESRTYYHYHY